MQRRTVQLASRLHVMLYRASGGLIGHHGAGIDCLLLTTTGNRSGKQRTVPLLYLRDGPDYVVVASYGGRPHDPDWYVNLSTQPRAVIQVGRSRFDVIAERVSKERRKVLWQRAVAAWADYEAYQARTGREIPVVLLRTTKTRET